MNDPGIPPRPIGPVMDDMFPVTEGGTAPVDGDDVSGSQAVLPQREIGSTVAGRYLIRRPLGRGGMGAVYHCLDQKLGREVALKFLLRGGDSALSRVKAEASSVSNLQHGNIVRLYDYELDAGSPFLSMEYLEGLDLRAYVKERGRPLDSEEVLGIAEDVCQALEYAHSQGVIHRDIKPTNLFRLKDGTVKLLDFGLAKAGASFATSSTRGAGTAHYVAPEQSRNASVANERSDLYSLGATLYFLLTGFEPSSGMRESVIPAAWKALVLQLCEESPGARPDSAREVLQQLRALAPRSSGVVAHAGLVCPACRQAHSLDAVICSCGASLRVKCDLCEQTHRVGITHCDKCGGKVGAGASTRGLVEAMRALMQKGELRAAQAMLDNSASVRSAGLLGHSPRAKTLAQDLAKIQKDLGDRLTTSTNSLPEIEEDLYAGRIRHGLKRLEQLERTNVDLRVHIEELRSKALELEGNLKKRHQSVLLQLEEIAQERDAGYLKVGLNKLEKAREQSREMPEDEGLRAKIDQLAQQIQARKKQADEAVRLAKNSLIAGQISKAITHADAALRLDRDHQSWRDEFGRNVNQLQHDAAAFEREMRSLVADAGSALKRGDLDVTDSKLSHFKRRAETARALQVLIADWAKLDGEARSIGRQCGARRSEVPDLRRKYYEDSRDMHFRSAKARLHDLLGRDLGSAEWVKEQLNALELREQATKRLREEEQSLIKQVRSVGAFGPLPELRTRLEDLRRRGCAHSRMWPVAEYEVLDRRLGEQLVRRKNLIVGGVLVGLFCLWWAVQLFSK